jgi:hypothetical protein
MRPKNTVSQLIRNINKIFVGKQERNRLLREIYAWMGAHYYKMYPKGMLRDVDWINLAQGRAYK